MKNLLFLLLLSYGMITGCNNAKQDFSEEHKAVSEVIKVFGGSCKYSVVTGVSTKGNSKVFELECSESKLVDDFSNMLSLPASGIAYTFHSNLTKDDYDAIQVVLTTKEGKEYAYSFPASQLKTVKTKMTSVNEFIAVLKSRQYNELNNQIDTSIISAKDKLKLINAVVKAEQESENIQSFIPLGFRFDELNQTSIVHISGIIKRASDMSQFSIDFDTLNRPSKPLLVNYEF